MRKSSRNYRTIGSAGFVLSEAQRRTLEQASAIKLGFPHDFYEVPMVRNLVYGGLRDRIKA